MEWNDGRSSKSIKKKCAKSFLIIKYGGVKEGGIENKSSSMCVELSNEIVLNKSNKNMRIDF